MWAQAGEPVTCELWLSFLHSVEQQQGQTQLSYLLRWFERSVKLLQSDRQSKLAWRSDLEWLYSHYLKLPGEESIPTAALEAVHPYASISVLEQLGLCSAGIPKL